VASVIRSRMAARSVCLTPRRGAPPSKASAE
jgi:hypothetical protein